MFKSIIIAIVLSTTATMSSAFEWSQKDYEDTWNAVNAAGVPIYRVPMDGPVLKGVSYGIYNRGDNKMYLAEELNHAGEKHVLMHEAIHVLQDCRTGIMNYTDSEEANSIMKYVTAKTKYDIQNNYEYKDWPFEIEAESYARGEWHWTNNSLAQMLNKTC